MNTNKDDGQFDNKQSAIEHLMKYNPSCAQAILDCYLHTDKEDNLVLNFHVFRAENEMALFKATRESEREGASK